MVSIKPAAGQSEAPMTWFDRAKPLHLLFKNSFLFQELYLRSRLMSYQGSKREGDVYDSYRESAFLERHIGDLSRFVSMGVETGASVVVIPFEISTVADEEVRSRYKSFGKRTIQAGIPALSIENAFTGHQYDQLTVNTLDRHPNEHANRLAAEAVGKQLVGLADGALILKKADSGEKGL